MLIKKLKIHYFGRFTNKEVELKPGINLIYGDNEAGKSTIHTFIKGMLFGIERMRGRAAASKEDLYTRYLPWDYPGAYGGSMDVEIEGREYQLKRSFHASDKSFSVIDLLTGREVPLKEGMISELIPGLSEATFKNTISIEQLKARTDIELATQVRNYIANLSVARSQEVNVAKAINQLNDQRKQLELAQNPMALKALQAEIEEGEAREERMDRLTLQLRELLAQEQQLLRQRDDQSGAMESEVARRMEQLPAILEKYHSYVELQNQMLQLEHQLTELENKLSVGERQYYALDQLKVDKKEADLLLNELYKLSRQEQELTQVLDTAYKSKRKLLYYSMSGATVIALLIAFFSGFHVQGLLLAAGSLILVGVFYSVLNGRKHRSIRDLKSKQASLIKQRTEAQNKVMDILTRQQVDTLEALVDRQEELLRSLLAMEHAKDQQKEIEARKSMVQDNMDSLYDTIMTYLQYFIRVDELTPETMQRITEEHRLIKQESIDKQAKLNESYEACRLQIEKLRWEIAALEGNEAELQKKYVQYDKIKHQQEENATELEAIKLALSTIGELSAQIHDSFGHQLNHAVSEVISQVTGERYKDLKVDEKLDIKVGWKGAYVMLERLSAGTIDQVFFALRLVTADLLLGKDQVPLIFDDSFALYDDARVKAALAEVAKRKQTILFTCHKREQRLLEELQLPYHLVNLS